MRAYIAKRVAYMLLTLFIISTATFWLMHSVPSDPLTARVQRNLPPQVRENFMKKYGLDKPIYVQYWIFLKNMFTQGDMGESITYPGQKVTDIIKKNAPISGALGIRALAIGFVLGIAMGILAALKHGRWPDYLVMTLAILGITLPSFVLASLLQYFFSVQMKILPSMGWGSWKNMVMPIFALCLGTIATYARYMRSSVMEVMNQDYILTAEAKGCSRQQVIWKHMFRNAFIPQLTMLGPQIAGVFSGSFIIEKIFAIPGLGFYLVRSISDRDYPMIIATTIFFAFLFTFSQLVVDILYGLVDPRIKLASNKG